MKLAFTTDDHLLLPPPEVMLSRFLGRVPDESDFERVETALLDLPQADFPLTHRFAPGVYAREMFAQAGSFIIGASHREEAINVMLSGRALVMQEGVIRELRAPQVFRAKPGRKVAYAVEDVLWLTVHSNPDDETDPRVLEDRIAEFTPTIQAHRQARLADSGSIYTERTEPHEFARS